MPSQPVVPVELHAAYNHIHEKTKKKMDEGGSSEGFWFENFCLGTLGEWLSIPKDDQYWVGEKGKEKKLDIGMIDRINDKVYIGQCKYRTTKDPKTAKKHNKDDLEETKLAYEWLCKLPNADDSEKRKIFATAIADHFGITRDQIKDLPRDNFKLIFCTNTARSYDDVSNALVDDELIDVFDLERFNNIYFSSRVFGNKPKEFSHQLDIYHSTEEIGEGKITTMYGLIKAKDLADFCRVEEHSNSRNDLLFSDNLRFQLMTAQAKDIRNDILTSLIKQSDDFNALNNGLLILGRTSKGCKDGFETCDESKAWANSQDKTDLEGLVHENSKSPLKGAKKDKMDALNEEKRKDSEKILSIKIREPGIINGGQTSTAIFDYIISGKKPKDGLKDISISTDEEQNARGAFVFCKFCFIEEKDVVSKHALAIASNKQNPITEIDHLSLLAEQKLINTQMESLPVKILYLYKRGLYDLQKKNYGSSIHGSTYRTLEIEQYGLALLSTIHADKSGAGPAAAKSGKKSAKLFTDGSDNYKLVYEEPTKHHFRTVLFSRFVLEIAEALQGLVKEKMAAQKKEDDAQLAATPGEKEKEQKEMTQIAKRNKSLSFPLYWNYAIISHIYRILKYISKLHLGEEKTIFADAKTVEDGIDILFNKLMNSDGDFLENEEVVDLCFHSGKKVYYSRKSKDEFSEQKDKDKVKVHYACASNNLMILDDSVYSTTHPILFQIIQTICTKYASDWAWDEGKGIFQNTSKITEMTTNLELMAVSEKMIEDNFGIRISTVLKPQPISESASAPVAQIDKLLLKISAMDEEDEVEDLFAMTKKHGFTSTIDIGDDEEIKDIHRYAKVLKVQNIGTRSDFITKMRKFIEDEKKDSGGSPVPDPEPEPEPEPEPKSEKKNRSERLDA